MIFRVASDIGVARYDMTGVSNEDLQRVVQDDWVHLMRDKRVLDSPNYLKEKGRPVVALWGKACQLSSRCVFIFI